MKNILYSLLAVFIFNTSHSQGLILSSKEELNSFEKYEVDEFGFGSDLPSYYSLEKYVPPVLKQVGNSCVGYSAMYYTMTTMHNKKFEYTDYYEKFIYSFDPLFVYSQVKQDKDECVGVTMKSTLDYLINNGSKKVFMPPSNITCDAEFSDEILTKLKNFTNPFKINKVKVIDAYDPLQIVTKKIKQNIYNNSPVIIGMYLPNSFNFDHIKSDGVWTPIQGEPKATLDSGHAMSIIGYDDYKNGGSFRIVNSWGRDFGDNGYVWVSYEDFYSFSSEAYVFELLDNIISSEKIQIKSKNFIKLTDDNNSTYEGEYYNGRMNGFGIQFINNVYFIGEFNNGVKNGSFAMLYDGEFSFPNYDIYGEFVDFDSSYGMASDNSEKSSKIESFIMTLNPEMGIKKSKSAKKN